MGVPVADRTPADITDPVEFSIDDGGCNGFMMLSTDTTKVLHQMADLVMPELQRPSRFRGSTPTSRESLQPVSPAFSTLR